MVHSHGVQAVEEQSEVNKEGVAEIPHNYGKKNNLIKKQLLKNILIWS